MICFIDYFTICLDIYEYNFYLDNFLIYTSIEPIYLT